MSHATLRRRAFLAASLSLPAIAHAQTPSVEPADAWARATTAQARAGGVFLTLRGGAVADRLLHAESPVATTAEMHETVQSGDVMEMRPIPALPIPANVTVALKPGSYHIMLMGLQRQLKPGDTFPVTLQFEKAGAKTVTVTVGAAGASGPAPQSHIMPAKP
jgi:copper(I)-binding protein